jgi:DNA modification methylase
MTQVFADIRLGDAYDLSAKLEPNSIDLVVTSPPYWGHRSYGLEHNWDILSENPKYRKEPESYPGYDWYRSQGGALGLEPYPEWYILNLIQIFDRLKPAVKESGSLWVNLGDTYFARWSSIRDGGRQGLGKDERVRRRTPMGGFRQEKQMLLIPSRFAIAMQERRWILRNDLIWHKSNVPPRPETDRLRLSHEHFFHFVHRPTEGRAKYYYKIDEAEDGALDVVHVKARAGEGHSATFPESLIVPRILTSCPPGGTVLDPFCGSGTAVKCALRLKRRAIGFEKAPAHFKLSSSRIVPAAE